MDDKSKQGNDERQDWTLEEDDNSTSIQMSSSVSVRNKKSFSREIFREIFLN